MSAAKSLISTAGELTRTSVSPHDLSGNRGHTVNFHDDITGFGALNSGAGPQEVTLGVDGQLSPLDASTGHGGSTGGTSLSHTPPQQPTPVKSPNGMLTIELVWDASVASTGGLGSLFENTVIAAATALVNALGSTTTHQDTVYIDVGWGEIGGMGMSPSALGESMTNGYLVNYDTVNSLLGGHLTYLNSLDPTGATHDSVGSSSTMSSTTQFFLATGEAKALGYSLASPGSPSSPDGYIGISTLGKGWSWEYSQTDGTVVPTTAANWYNLYGDALHELSEAMGRISMEGLQTMHGHKTYTPLDLFDYTYPSTSPPTLALSNTGGYFSINGGATPNGIFNNAKATPGDIADWSSFDSPSESGTTMPTTPGNWEDAFNAYGFPEYNDVLSPEDVLLMQALGY
jgi:hypothetical protein